MSQSLIRPAPKGSALIIAMAIVVMLASLSTILMNEMHTRSHRVETDMEDIKAFEAAEAGIDAAIFDINQTPVRDVNEHPVIMSNPSLAIITPAINGQTGKPVYVHDWSLKPGCLGTRNWNPATDDTIPPVSTRASNYVARPSWLATPKGDGSSNHENNIIPQQLGNVAFFTYAVDWLWDGIDNDADLEGKVGGSSLIDKNERNKFTIYSTGIHKGIQRGGITTEGRVVTVEVVVQANDVDLPPLPGSALELQVKKRE